MKTEQTLKDEGGTLGRAELTQVFFEKLSLDKKVASGLLETLIDALVDNFKQGQPLKIQGFGSFSVHQKNERPGRNPKTQKTVTISSRRVVRLRPSALFQKRLNNEI